MLKKSFLGMLEDAARRMESIEHTPQAVCPQQYVLTFHTAPCQQLHVAQQDLPDCSVHVGGGVTGGGTPFIVDKYH
jgi:hypothetical protein